MKLEKYFNFKNNDVTYGLTDELIAFYLLSLFKEKNKNVILVTSNLYESNKLFNIISFYTDKCMLFPMDDYITSMVLASSPEFKLGRLNVLEKLAIDKKIIVTNLMGYLKFLPNKNVISKFKLKNGQIINRDDLISKLVAFGYNKESIVTTTGEFSVRGFIIDIFPVNYNHPIRIEFFDNEIESLRYFDESNQRTLEDISKIEISSFIEIDTDIKNSLYEYSNQGIVVFLNKDQIDIVYQKLCEEIILYQKQNKINQKLMYELNEINPKYELYIDNINNPLNYSTGEIPNFNEDYELLKKFITNWEKDKKEIIFCLTKDKQIKIIKKYIPNAKIKNYKLNKGFLIDKFVYISENDIGSPQITKNKYINNLRIGKKIKSYNDIEKGDYIVHINHGIGIYNGLVTIKKGNLLKDYIQLLYKNNDKIYIPVEKIDLIYKYGSKDGTKPTLNSLDSTSWEKTKIYVKKKAQDISKELLDLYTKRSQIKKVAYKSFVEEEIFASLFGYILTPDQVKSINEINRDLESNIPMDRLLCGDVGFGKTEVAMRAAYKTILNNKQVMYLCPTTILSKQQYEVFKNRFKNDATEIKLLNRFTSIKDTNDILNNFAKGKIDILIGTHRILSNDVKPLKLGLLVIDEEQRFGVAHKEKIKQYKNDVNVLTLSATPIPRTLKMALSGLRDLSIIDTPPINRYPIQTYVIEENDLLIKDAIYKELARGGQVFILDNRIEKLDKTVYRIQNLVKEARICFAHGKMRKEKLESVMEDFINYKYDILICTTIIENGIDISNVNTLIIFDADNFGLSQLYQIRGRVGRSNKIAYAYLLYNGKKLLNETAVKRLNAIKEFTELGSGYKIALRDLSIRGAGDIFGSEQAGYVDSVGVSLYLKLIENEFKKAKGEKVIEEEDTPSLIEVSTHIKDSYVSDEDVKIEIHQKINEIDSLEKLIKVKEELRDRFGKIDNELEIYMYEEWFDHLCQILNINKVNKTDKFIQITLPEELSNHIKGDKLLLETMNITNKFMIKYINNTILITLYYQTLPKHYIYYLVTLLTFIKDN